MRKLLISIIFLVLLCNTVYAGQNSKISNGYIDQDYVLALSSVNLFLSAWQIKDQEGGLALLSPRLKRQFSEDDLRMYISGLSNPHHQAYEVGLGKRLKDGRYAFEVRFYEHYTGEKYREKRPKTLKIIVVKVGEENWLIDDIPELYE